MTRQAPPTQTAPPAAGTLVVEEARFAIVPEWVIDAAISDGAFRLYSLLLRYGNGSGSRMPSRQTLARRLRRSVDAIDRAMRQLTEAGIGPAPVSWTRVMRLLESPRSGVSIAVRSPQG